MPLGAFKAGMFGAASGGGGGANVYEYITHITGDASSSNYTFSSLPTDYKTLRMVINAKYSSTQWRPIVRINNQSNYYRVSQFWGSSGSYQSSGQTGLSGVYMSITPTNYACYTATIDFPEYNSTAMVCPILLQIGTADGTSASPITVQQGALFNGSAAISEINLVGANGYNLSTGSTVALFGLKE